MAKQAPHKVMYVRAAPEIAEAVERLALKENRSVSNMAETIMRRYLEQVKELPKIDTAKIKID